MPEPTPTDAQSSGEGRGPRHRFIRPLSLVAGLLLLGAASYVIAKQRDELSDAWHSVAAAPGWLIGAVLLLPLANWVISSAIFWILTRRLAPVGKWEMAALIGSAWLLNMLPFKPGLVGRLAYHKAISGIPVVKSVLVTLTALLTGGAGIVITLLAQLVFDEPLRRLVGLERLAPVAAGIVLAAVLPGAVLALRRKGEAFAVFGSAPVLGTAVLLRVADMHIWSLRYFLAFRLIAHDQPYGICVVVAGVSQIAAQLPLLGVREWAVGVTSGVLRPVPGVAGAASAAPGLTVDILCRVTEIACAIPVGVASYIWVFRHLRRARA